jgi:uncharacterized protein
MIFQKLGQRLGLGLILTIGLQTGCTLSANGSDKTAGCVAGVAQGQSPAGLQQVSLCITSGEKTRAFTVEVAGSSMEQAKGLMFRTELSDDKGMIFPFPQPKPASFWMKNTAIPLDILFIRSNGTIESIAENTIPYSTSPVEAGEPVGAVLELRGGLTADLGISAGDRVEWQAK